jgi:hypothetical protein
LIFTCAFDYEKAKVNIVIPCLYRAIVKSKARLLNLKYLPLSYAVVVVLLCCSPVQAGCIKHLLGYPKDRLPWLHLFCLVLSVSKSESEHQEKVNANDYATDLGFRTGPCFIRSLPSPPFSIYCLLFR